MKKLILTAALTLLTSQAFATMHYTCDFKMKSGEELRMFSYSDIDFIEVQSSTEGTDIINNVRMLEKSSTLSFLVGDLELISINKGEEGENVEGRMNHATDGEIKGICSSFEDIGP